MHGLDAVAITTQLSNPSSQTLDAVIHKGLTQRDAALCLNVTQDLLFLTHSLSIQVGLPYLHMGNRTYHTTPHR